MLKMVVNIPNICLNILVDRGGVGGIDGGENGIPDNQGRSFLPIEKEILKLNVYYAVQIFVLIH